MNTTPSICLIIVYIATCIYALVKMSEVNELKKKLMNVGLDNPPKNPNLAPPAKRHDSENAKWWKINGGVVGNTLFSKNIGIETRRDSTIDRKEYRLAYRCDQGLYHSGWRSLENFVYLVRLLEHMELPKFIESNMTKQVKNIKPKPTFKMYGE